MATEVSDYLRDTQPYSSIGTIEATFSDGYQIRGTCTIIGVNDILTAAHLVYDLDHGGWAGNFTFNFGADYNATTGLFEDYGYEYSPSSWDGLTWLYQMNADNEVETLEESQFDIAIIGVDTPIGDTLGWLGLDLGYNDYTVAKAVGYPAGATGMIQETVYVDKHLYYNLYESNYDVMWAAGSSGGPLLIENNVIGVRSTGARWADVSVRLDGLVDEMDSNNSLLSTISDDYVMADDYGSTISSHGDIIDSAEIGNGYLIGTGYYGNIETGTDHDWFSAWLNSGQSYQFDVFGSANNQGTLEDPTLTLRNSSGSQIDYNDDGGSGSLDSQLIFTPTYSGTFFLDVTSLGDSATGTYRIEISAAGGGSAQTGTNGDDNIYGGAGNDYLQGFEGNDLLVGGAGIDTAIFSGSRANHTIAKTAAGWTVYSSVNGFDTLSDIERLQFSDKTIALDIDGNAGQAYRVYQAAFDRTPDNSGLNYWISFMDAGNSLETVASGFIDSNEFTALYGPNPTNRDFVSKLYNNVLHRTPDQGGYDYWVNLLDTGAINKTETLVNFSESTENQVAVMGVIEYGIELF